MFTELEDFSDSKQYLEKTQAAITLRGKQENYSRAAQLAREGKYEQALTIYKELGEYEDAAEQAVEMQNRIDYNKAGDLVKKEKFDEAIAIYTRLAEIGYGSAESLKKQAEQTRANELAYQQALSLAEQGEYQKAKDRFSKLYGYKDASDQADLMQKHLRYQAAEQHLEKEEFDDAIAIFTELDDFSDAKERARQTETVKKNEQDYQSALELFEQGQYREAYHIFNQLGEYKEAAAQKEQSLGYVKYQTNGDETGEFVLGNPVTGENLLMNSALERPSENGALRLDVRGILESYVDLPITISFDAKTNGDKRTVTVSAYQASGISIADSMSFTVPSDKYDRYSFTTSVKDYQYKIDPLTAQKLSDGAIEFSDGTEDSKGFTIKNIKIEVGTKATPWGFAPGDPLITGKNLLIGGGQMRTSSQGTLKVDLGDILKDCVGQPVTVSFEAKAKGDSLRVRVSSDANGAFTLQETASIDVNSSGYQSYSFHSTVQANEGKTSPSVLIFDCLAKNRKDFSISKLKIEIGTEATAWSFAPNDPAVTGDNLLKDSALIRQAKNGMVRIGVADVLEPYAGMPICISFDAIAEGNEEVVLRVSPYQSNGISIEESHECVLTNTNKGYTRCSFTDRVRTVDLADGGEIGAYGQGEIAFISDSYKGFTIKNIKIEVGDHPTDWSFAPNDPLVTGDNLLVGGGQTKKSESGQLRIDVRDALAGSVGQPITISFEAKAEGSRAHMLEMSAYQESGISIADKYSFSVSSKQYKKFSFTTTVTDYGYKVNKQTGEMLSGGSISVSDLGTPTQEFSIRNLKIEVGVEPTDWKYAANDPVVTGDNLFRDSAKARQANDGFLSIPTRNILEPYTGMMICVSFDAKVNTENGFDIQVYPYQDSGISVDGSRTFHLTQEYARYSFVGQVKDFGIREKDGKKYSRGELAFYNKERQSFTVKNIKIEVGTKNTPWSFAPNDPLAKKTGVNLLVGGGMTRKSESGYVGINVRNALADYVGQPVTISFDVMMLGKESRTLRMYAYQDSGISIADKFEFQAVPKKYTRQKFTTTVADYGILADPKTGAVRSSGILSFFDPTSPKSKKQDFLIRNVKIEIGTKATEWSLAPNDPLMTPTGENLLVGGGLAKKSNGGGFLAIGVNNALTEYVGQPITVSFEAKMLGEESRTLKMYAYQDSGVSIADVFEFKTEPNQYQQYSFTTSVYDYGIRTAPDTGKQYSLGELAFLDASEAKQEFSIRHVKIELGYKATDWTFAANDPLVNGSNLLKDSAKVRHDQNGFLSVDVWDALEPYIGMPITVSFDAKSDTAEEIPIRVYPYQNSGVSIETSHDFNLTTSYKRYSFVDRGYLFGKRPDDYGGKYSKGAIAFFNESHKEFSVKNVKIELGEVKNPLWCMAVDDPLNKIIGQNLLIGGAQTRSSAGGFLEVAVRDALADYLDQPITISFEAMTVGEKSRTLQVYAYQTSGISIADREEFTVQPNQYQSFVMHTSVRDFGIRVNPDTGKMLSSGSLAFYDPGRQEFKIRNIKIEAGNEQSDWSYAPNDPVVSGENLLKNSARVRRSSENGFLSIPTADILAPYTGMTVCVSFEAKTNTGNEFDIEVYPYQESGVTVDGKQTIHLTSKYATYSYIGKVQDFGIREKEGQKFSAGEIGFYSKEHKIFSIRNIKIEVGLEPTPWSFAPGDPSVTGDNLLMDSAKIRTAPNGQLSIDVGEALEPYVGMPVCISFEAKAEKDDGLALQVSPYRNSGVTIEESHKVSLSTTYKRYTITDWVTQLGTAESTAGKANFRGGISFSSTGSKGFSVKNIKIEVGVKPTDWSFAPNDTILTGDNLLKGGGKNRRSNGGGFLSIEVREALDHYVGQPVTISFEAMMEGDESCTLQMYAYQTSGISIADRAEFQVEPRKYQKFSFTTSVVNYGYRINSESGKRFSDGEIAFLDPGKTKHEFRIRNVKIEVGVEPTEWRYAADDPAINGENLLLDSAKVRQTGNGFLGVGIWEDLKSYEGQYVCISFDAKVNGNEGFPIKVYPYQESGLSIGSSKEFALTTDFSRYAFVTQIIDYGQRYEKGQRLSLGEIGFINSERRDFTVRNIKIEIGNKETPWTFAPRDPLLALKGANLLPGDGHARQSVGGFMEFNVFTALRKYENQPVTISFDACMLGNESRTLRMYPYQTSGISIADSFEFTVNPGAYQTFKFTTWVRNFGIRTDTSGNQYTNGSIGFYDPTLQREGFDIRRLKIEIGTEKTPWSPGPMTEESTSGVAE
ncbi:MAG: tetratricopeptide repeat protein [Clostridiales bacterium]|nr:tetratricopeptide repeat protein [Clostridiales bacterium]